MRAGLLDVFSIAHLALLIVTVAFLVWSVPRGLDITDEGMYLLTSQYPEEVKATLSSAHFYTAALFTLVGLDIASFRLLGLLLTLGSALVFAFGLLRVFAGIPVLRPASRHSVLIIVLIALGATLMYGWTLRTPSYNTLTAFSTTAFAGLLLMVLPVDDASRSRSAVLLLLMLGGMAIGVCFYSKFPAALALFVSGLTMLGLWPRLTHRAAGMAAMILGAALWGVVHFLLIESFPSWLASWREGFAVWSMLDTGYGESPMRKSIREAFEILTSAGWKYRGLLIALLVVLALSTLHTVRNRLHGWPLKTILGLTGVVFLIQSVSGGFFLGGDEYFRVIMRFYIGAVLITGLALVLAARIGGDGALLRRPAVVDLRLVLLIGWFAALPFLAAVGTSNPLYLNSLLTMAPWFALLAILLAVLSELTRSVLVFRGGALLISAFACSQITTGYQVSPYRLNAPIQQQTVNTAIGSPETRVHLDPQTARFFDTIRHAAYAGGLRSGDDVLAFFNMPGVVYALGAHSPVAPWYHAGYPGAKKMNEYLVSLVPSSTLARAYILHKEGNPESLPDLRLVGLAFPQNYEPIADAVWPITGQRVRLWKPRPEHHGLAQLVPRP